jgi:phosphopantothenoylcysteine decarboxylase/phosphopantothenate--cysteine ligase
VTTERSLLQDRRVLLGVTGGIAAYKACILVRLLRLRGASVRVVMTRSAERFVGPATFAALSDHRVYTDLWEEPGVVLHVRLAHEADVAVVAPATANVLAKLAQGIADDLLTSTLLEASCPLVLAPAMHTGMWEHPATQANANTLAARGARIVGPARGALAAGDEGMGRMTEPDGILRAIEDTLAAAGDLSGKRIVVTAGPTWEPIDPVRFVGNRSTGKMGFAVAAEAFARGAAVTLVVGPGTLEPPIGPAVTRVTTADEMRRAVLEAAPDADAVVMAAAVADFRPKAIAETKLKKRDGVPDVVLEPTPDILAGLGARKRAGQTLVGFAAETADLVANAEDKVRRKGLDLVVANDVSAPGVGFEHDTNAVVLLGADGSRHDVALADKRAVARAVLDAVLDLRK